MLGEIKAISKKDFFKIIACRYSVSIARKIVVLSEGARIYSNELDIIYRTARSIKPRTILEIGTGFGYTTLGLCVNAIDADVYTIDIYKEMKIEVPSYQKLEVLSKNKVGTAFNNKISAIHQILGDSRNAKTYSMLKGKTVDFAFIDGNHSFEAVLRDTRNVLKFVRKNSIIFWHDFNEITGVKMALSHLISSDRLKIFCIDKTWLAFSILKARIFSK